MARWSLLTRAKELVKGLHTTILLIIGLVTVFGTLEKGVTGFILGVAADWHTLRSSADVREMVGDAGAGVGGTVTYLGNWWLQLSVVAGVVVITHVARLWLIVWPREREKSALAAATEPLAKPKKVKGNPDATA